MRITGRTKLAGIMGSPVSHSRSPALHNFWIDEHGVDGVYDRPRRPRETDQRGLAGQFCVSQTGSSAGRPFWFNPVTPLS